MITNLNEALQEIFRLNARVIELEKTHSVKDQLQKVVIRAAAIHEDNYDHVAADALQVSDTEYKNFSQFYKYSLAKSCEMACRELNLAGCDQLIYLALDSWWNDTLYWAEKEE